MNISTYKDKNSIQFKSHVFNFYCVFCSFGYYTLLIPYKFEWRENGYEIYTSNIRKASKIIFNKQFFLPTHPSTYLQALCSVVHLFILVLGIGNLRKKFAVPRIVDKPNQFFIMAEGICLFGYILVFIHMVLWKQNVFVNIIKASAEDVDSKINSKVRCHTVS